jgi:hypothetical protein
MKTAALQNIEKLPDDARVWVYGLDRPLDADTRSRVEEVLDHFVSGWESHQVPVEGAYGIVEDRFILLAGHCTDGISGCSTDSSVRVIKALHEHLGVNGLDRSLVYYRTDDGAVHALNRVDFQKKVSAGILGEGTTVFDTTIQHVSDLRSDKFETTFEKSWHAMAFKR